MQVLPYRNDQIKETTIMPDSQTPIQVEDVSIHLLVILPG
jgi:hypothetical protein